MGGALREALEGMPLQPGPDQDEHLVNPKVVSEQLGHASIRITLDTYSHVLPDMQETAAAAMEAALS